MPNLMHSDFVTKNSIIIFCLFLTIPVPSGKKARTSRGTVSKADASSKQDKAQDSKKKDVTIPLKNFEFSSLPYSTCMLTMLPFNRLGRERAEVSEQTSKSDEQNVEEVCFHFIFSYLYLSYWKRD